MRHPFLRSAGGVEKDPHFKNVTLLLHGDGTNGGQNNTFVDSSANNFAIARNGNTTQGTFSPYGDNWSNYFDGTGDYLSMPSNAAFAYGTGEFTVECWVYKLTSATMAVLDSNTGSPGTFGFAILATQISAYQTWGTAFTFTHTLALNSWQHIAFVRTSGTLYLYVNGTQIGSTAASQNFVSTQPLIVGRNAGSGSDQYNGYISNLRIVKGAAVYTAAFTPPTAPLTAITNTSLLTCQSNRFRDASTNNFTITRNGDVSVQRFSPFSPTAPYAAGTIGGSGYFDGTTDYLTGPSDAAFGFGTGDFTLECWAYTFADVWLFDFRTSINQALPALYGGSTDLVYYVLGANRITATGLPAFKNKWTHFAVCRSGTSTKLFLDGSQVGSTWTDNTNYATAAFKFGRNENGTAHMSQSYCTDIRVVKGTALYTANFAPPTAPLTAVTNTSLLLSCTNAAIIDNAMMVVPETVGDAQIDTTIKKYGTGSMEFDAIGDRMITPSSPDNAFGTGNFTIEFWVYRTGGGQRAFISTRTTSTTGWSVSTDGSNRVLFNYDSSSFSTSSTLANNTWYHIAVVREGTGTNQTKIYINGTSSATGTVASDFAPSGIAIAVSRTTADASAGYFDDLRITKGVARYTANFTPPAAPYPDA